MVQHRPQRSRRRHALVPGLLLGLALLFSSVPSALADATDPVDRARYELATKLVGQKRFEEARAIARLLVAENPKWMHPWVLLGLTYANDKATYELAEDAFEHAHKLDSKSPDPLRSLAALASAREDDDEAADYLLQAAQRAEDDLDLQVTAARMLVQARRMAEAKQRYDLVLEAEPDNLQAVSGYGSLLVELGEYSRAIEIYRAAMASGQDHVLLHNNLVDALVRGARYDEAVQAADLALAKHEDPLIEMHKVRALTYLGRLDEATTLGREVLAGGRLQGDQAVFGWYQVGIAEALRGCPIEQIAACHELDARDAAAAASAPACCGHVQAALDAFQKAYDIRPTFRDTTIRLGLAQFAAGKLEDAEATLKTYIEQKGDKVEAEAFGALAVTLYRFGEDADVAESVRVYREARELAPDFDSGERLAKFRLWPPYAIAIIEKLRTMADDDGKAAGRGEEGSCGCVALAPRAADAPRGRWPALLVLLGLGFLVARRRHA